MKLSHLKQLVKYFNEFSKISAIYRISDMVVKIVFDKDDDIYFDMERNNSAIYKCDKYIRSKVYNAPFDIILSKRFNRCHVLDVSLVNDDKLLRFTTVIKDTYKEIKTYLQFEFTGKYTNIIILDEDEIILEALRHIDIFSSFREIRVGQNLLLPPKANFVAKEYPISNIELFLKDTCKENNKIKVECLKRQKTIFLQKKLIKLQKIYENIQDEQQLLKNAKNNEHLGNLVLSNLHLIKPYEKVLHVKDYDDKEIVIKLDEVFALASDISKYFFKLSKKQKQKAKNLYIERTSLEQKIKFVKHFLQTVENVKEISELELLFPPKREAKKIKQDESIEQFFIGGYKVSMGKNEKGNIKLLKRARARDIWIHLKDTPSAHVIISTDKQALPQNIIYEASKLCVQFSTFDKGRYLVDYTPRREVKVQEGAHVLYNRYKTIEVDTR